jgi:2,3-bisphosphoglycerate-independent phosphoglycerate mutase
MNALRLVLLIIDGFGESRGGPGDAIAAARMPAWRALLAAWPHARLAASGEAVGLPAGQMGNSEVGHLNIGAGQCVPQDLPRIDAAIASGDLDALPELHRAVAAAKGGTLHLIVLLGPGGVHAHDRHAVALARAARRAGAARIAVHLILDGRDTPPRSARTFLDDFASRLAAAAPEAFIATVAGRSFAMDRDGRWERTTAAVVAIATGEGLHAKSAAAAIDAAYARGEGDEFVTPTVIDAPEPYRGLAPGDAILHGNFRADRARELTQMLSAAAFAATSRPANLPVPMWGMTAYEEIGGAPALFGPAPVPSLAGLIAAQGGIQLHIAETEKYAHVTYFLNGGREEPFPGEQRHLIPSEHVATYDRAPQMRAAEIAAAVVEGISTGAAKWIVANLANPDMVGHTGNFSATVAACEATDAAIGHIAAACASQQNILLAIVGDHGNAEEMLAGDGTPRTSHSLASVPFLLAGARVAGGSLVDGALRDVAPTLCALLTIEPDPAMTGANLFRA